MVVSKLYTSLVKLDRTRKNDGGVPNLIGRASKIDGGIPKTNRWYFFYIKYI